MAKKQVTFADIAEYTHFSKTTISRYFNHPDSLTLENQEKISPACFPYHQYRTAHITCANRQDCDRGLQFHRKARKL